MTEYWKYRLKEIRQALEEYEQFMRVEKYDYAKGRLEYALKHLKILVNFK